MKRFLAIQAGVLLVAAAALLYVGQRTDLDLILARHYFDTTTQSFPWREDWFAATLMHQHAKQLAIALGLSLLAFVIFDWFRPRPRLSESARLRLRVVCLVLICSPLAIAAIKSRSAMHCPWDLELFGASEPYVRILDPVPPQLSPGRCFPAGHASSALWLMAFALFWLPQQAVKGALAWCVLTLPGMILGWVQQLRGAHFVTHTLWSIWITWALCVGWFALLSYCAASKSRQTELMQ